MRILFFEVEKWQVEIFKRAFPYDEVICFSATLQNAPLTSRDYAAQIISIFIRSKVDYTTTFSFSNLKLIITRSNIYDHIDLHSLPTNTITVCRLPNYASITVAEHTIGLMLMLSRSFYSSYNYVAQQLDFAYHPRGFELYRKVVGVVGTGSIGQHVIRIAHGFCMKILAYDAQPNQEVQEYASYVSLQELLSNADIITLHVPLNKHTFHLLNMSCIPLLKKGCYIINTARGGLIETKALVYGLQHEIIAGAGLDVVEDESYLCSPLKAIENDTILKITLLNQFLMRDPRVIITPHNAYNSREALERNTKSTIELIKAWQQGKPVNVI